MVTYIYWAIVIGLMLTAVFFIGIKFNNLVSGVIGAIAVWQLAGLRIISTSSRFS